MSDLSRPATLSAWQAALIDLLIGVARRRVDSASTTRALPHIAGIVTVRRCGRLPLSALRFAWHPLARPYQLCGGRGGAWPQDFGAQTREAPLPRPGWGGAKGTLVLGSPPAAPSPAAGRRMTSQLIYCHAPSVPGGASRGSAPNLLSELKRPTRAGTL